MDFATFLIQCLNAVQYGLLLFLVASGLTLIFGIMGVINLAHGSFYMIGAYMAYALAPAVSASFGGEFFSTLAVGLVLSVILGYVLEWAFFSYLYEREHLQQVLMTYGLILVFEELRSMLVGDDVHGVTVPEWLNGAIALNEVMTYPVYRLFMSGVCLLLAAAMWFVFTRTRLGMMIRAGTSNREMVQSLGIDITLLYRIVFAMGVALAVFAGMIAAPVSSVYPGMGNSVLIICFVVVVIGGIGSIKGALLAALLIGLVDTFGKVLLPQAAGVLVYVLMALILHRLGVFWSSGVLWHRCLCRRAALTHRWQHAFAVVDFAQRDRLGCGLCLGGGRTVTAHAGRVLHHGHPSVFANGLLLGARHATGRRHRWHLSVRQTHVGLDRFRQALPHVRPDLAQSVVGIFVFVPTAALTVWSSHFRHSRE